MSNHNKRYLGDGAYYECDGDGVWLTTSNGITTTNKIYLEQGVIEAFLLALAADFDPAKLAAIIGGKT